MKSLTLKIIALLIILAGLSVSCKEETPDPVDETPPTYLIPTAKLELGLYNPENPRPGVYMDRINFIDDEELEFISTIFPGPSTHYKYVIKRDSIQLIKMNGKPQGTHYFKIIHSKKFRLIFTDPQIPDIDMITYEKK